MVDVLPPFSVFAKRVYEKNYVEKKETASGGVVRVYDEKHVKERWAKKSKKIKALEKNITKLRKKYREDLTSPDEKVRAIAACVGLMDQTAIRIGNTDSVDDAGTFGATTLLKKHTTVSGNKIRFKFKGKSGVEQDHTLTDRAVVSAIKKLLSGKKPGDEIFEYEPGERVSSKLCNKYLAGFGISGKDLRGFAANHRMEEKVKKGTDYEKALEETADELGHLPKTLENQYLLPEFVKKHKKDDKKDKKSSLALPLTITADYSTELQDVIDEILGVSSNGAPAHTWKKDDLAGRVNHAPSFSPSAPHSDKTGQEESHYMHLSVISVKPGQKVQKGDVIGRSGNTGKTTGPHLHVERRVGGALVSPDAYIKEFYPTHPITSEMSRARNLNGHVSAHQGTDVGMPIGTDVYAMEDGIVGAVKPNDGDAGNFIQILHFNKTKPEGNS